MVVLPCDSHAWNFIVFTVLFLYLPPSWCFIGGHCYKSLLKTKNLPNDKIKETADLKKKSTTIDSLVGVHLGVVFWLNLLVTVVLTIMVISIVLSIKKGGEIKSFDPFAILDIPPGSDLKAIRKAYKIMSIKWHPERHYYDAAAEEKFVMIAKAYEALTDSVTKENFEKFGNPDGKQPLEECIGLPSWLIDSKNCNLVIIFIFYCIIVVVIIPFFTWKYFSTLTNFRDKAIMDNFHHSFDNSTLSVSTEGKNTIITAQNHNQNQNQTDTWDNSNSLCENEHYDTKLQMPRKSVHENSSPNAFLNDHDWVHLPTTQEHTNAVHKKGQ